MQAAVGDKNIWISIDETTDVEQRLIANFVFGILDGTKESAEKSYLLNAGVLEAANANTMAAFLNDSLHILWPDGIQCNRVLFAVTDAAAYMLATMKTFFPKMLHCTCFAHGVLRIAEFVRLEFTDVNALISNVKSIYCKAPSRRCQFRADFPELKLPSQPCITRWGTWIDAAEYYCDHLYDVDSAINKLSSDDSDVIRRTKEILKNKNLKNELIFIKLNFACLCEGIEKLQTKGLSLQEGIDVMEVVNQSLTQNDKRFMQKLDAVLKRNEGYTSLCKIKRIIFNNSKENDNFIDSLTPLEVANFKYCPVTSVDDLFRLHHIVK